MLIRVDDYKRGCLLEGVLIRGGDYWRGCLLERGCFNGMRASNQIIMVLISGTCLNSKKSY